MEDMQPDLKIAPNSKRFLNYIIDIVCYLLVCLILGFILGIVLALAGNSEFVNSPSFESFANIFALVILYLYYFVFELVFEATPGKFVTGTRVKTRKGLKPEPGAIALRSIIRFVPFEPLSFFFGQGWHDKWSKTIVVEINR